MNTNNKNSSRAFEGIRVVEFAALIAGPSCGKYLADHGADVIKVERYPLGDIARRSNRTSAARSPMFLQHNAGKRSLCVDVKRPEGMEIVRLLIAKADVVIEAFTPGVMARLGLGYEDLKALNPSVIMCSISGFGQSGPNKDRPGYAHISHAMTGWLGIAVPASRSAGSAARSRHRYRGYHNGSYGVRCDCHGVVSKSDYR